MRNCAVYILFIVLVPVLCSVPQGFIEDPKDGRGYKLMYNSKTWTAAKKACAGMKAKLAVPKSKEQFESMQKVVRSMQYANVTGAKLKFLVWIGISNLDNYKMWKNVDGENIEDTGFHTWAGDNNGLTSDDPREPHCVVMDATNKGLRDWWCNYRQPFICEVAPKGVS